MCTSLINSLQSLLPYCTKIQAFWTQSVRRHCEIERKRSILNAWTPVWFTLICEILVWRTNWSQSFHSSKSDIFHVCRTCPRTFVHWQIVSRISIFHDRKERRWWMVSSFIFLHKRLKMHLTRFMVVKKHMSVVTKLAAAVSIALAFLVWLACLCS